MRLLILSLLAPLLLGVSSAADRPNLIFILADDMGYGDTAHAGGIVPTPHLDRMAAEGVRFTDAHTTSSVCTPTRYGILTGRYNWRSELKKGVLWGESKPLIPTDRVTVAKFLQERGYTTGAVGKWHLGLGWTMLEEPMKPEELVNRGTSKGKGWNIDYSKRVQGGPVDLGFTHDFLYPASLDMPPYVYLVDDVAIGTPSVTKAFKTPNRPGAALADFEAENCLKDFARESRAFIAKCAEADSPFFLYLPLTSPHTPIVPRPEWQGKSGIGEYGDFLMETDWVVGEVLAELDARGLGDNTLVVFTADNGCSPAADIPAQEGQGHIPNGPLRGHKADIFEGGHRVPFLVRWPGGAPKGVECDKTVCTSDFFATAAEAIGALDEIPEAAAEDSFSMLSLIQDPGLSENSRPFTIHHSINGSFAIRRDNWKLCLCPDSGGWSDPRPGRKPKEGEVDPATLPPVQLFDLDRDLKETTNLAEEHPERVQELVDLLVQAIRDGRTTAGAPQSNEGWPDTFPQRVLEAYPSLAGE